MQTKVHWVSFLRLSGKVGWGAPQAKFPIHPADLWLMGRVPSLPVALAMVSYSHAGVGSSNRAAHGQLATSHSWVPLCSRAVFYEPIFSFVHELVHLSLWLDAVWCISVTRPGAEVKPRPSDECVGFWPWGHQGGLWLMLSRCWKGLACLGERVGVSKLRDTTPSGCSSCARQGKQSKMQLPGPGASSALPLLNASQRLLQLPRLWKTCS